MPFIPVPESKTLMCIWETRVRDYEAFAKNTGSQWTKPDFAQGPDHPAVNVSWNDAMAFLPMCRPKVFAHLPRSHRVTRAALSTSV